jgi:spermidine/putrescine transport system permease protein
VQQLRAARPRLGRRKEPHRLFWAALAAPGILWLALLFVVPFYAIVAIAAGGQDLFGYPVAVWNPVHWSATNFSAAWRDVAGVSAFVGPIAVRTLAYVAVASLLSLLIAYPAAYFVARYAGRRKGLFLVLLIAPFWISYMMRMLAWIDLLQTDGYVNKALTFAHLISQPVNWLGGLVLYAGLDRIDPALIEAGRDLGLGRVRTFIRVTLPLSRQPILTGMLITVLPMLGDYFTNQLLSGTSGTTMIGNVIDEQLTASQGLQEGQGAVFSLLFLLALVVPMIYYVVATNRSSRDAS